MKLALIFFLLFIFHLTSPASDVAPKSSSGLLIFHDKVSASLVSVATRIDEFFFNTKDVKIQNQTNLRFYQVFSKTEYNEYKSDFNFRLNLDLPNIEKKLKISIEKKGGAVEQTPSGSSDNLPTEKGRERELRGGLSYFLENVFDFNMKVSAGVRLGIPPTPFVDFKINRDFYIGQWRTRFYSSTFWSHRGGFGQSISLDEDYKFSENFLFRFVNEFTWLDSTDLINVSHGPTLYHSISQRRALAYSGRVNYSNRPSYRLDNYDLAISYRQAIIANVFYYEIVPRLTFPRDRNFSKIYSGLFQLELIF